MQQGACNMTDRNPSSRQSQGDRELFVAEVGDLQTTVMTGIADYGGALRDRDVDAIALASTLASELFILAHDMVRGLRIESEVARQQTHNALAGLLELADRASPDDDDDDNDDEEPL
jgi:hypothetical protein